MITGFFLQLMFIVVQFILQHLPILSLPSGVASGITIVVSYMNLFTFIFPVAALFTLLTLTLVVEVAILVWHFGWKFIHAIRGN